MSQFRSKRPVIKSIGRKALLAKTQGRCAYCGRPITLRTIRRDHVKPLLRYRGVQFSFGGHYGCKHPERHCAENIVAACDGCNTSKSSQDLETWRHSLKWPGATPQRPVVFWFERLALDAKQ